jgi:hypothetical protein
MPLEEKKTDEEQKLTELLQVLITPGMKQELEVRAYQESAPGEKVHVTTIVRRAIRAYLDSV